MSERITYRHLTFQSCDAEKIKQRPLKSFPLGPSIGDKKTFLSSLYELTETLNFFNMPFLLFTTGFVYFPLFYFTIFQLLVSRFCSSSSLNASVCSGSVLSYPVGFRLSRYTLPFICDDWIEQRCVCLTSTFMTWWTCFEVSSSLVAGDVFGCERRWHIFRKRQLLEILSCVNAT